MDNKEFIQQRWVMDEIISRLNYCPDTGELTWATRGVDHLDIRYAGKPVGQRWVTKEGYKRDTTKLEFKGRRVSIVTARLCWLTHTGDWPKNTIDHIDRNPFNNKWDNLRDITQAENNENRGLYKGNVFTHIRRNKGAWAIYSKGFYIGGSVCFGKAVKIRAKFLQGIL